MMLLIRPLFLLTLVLAAIVALPAHAKPSVAGNVEGMFRDMEKRLCQSIPSRKCKRAKSQRRKPAAAEKKDVPQVEPQLQAEPEPKRVEAAPKWKSLPPIPKRKPAIEAASAEAPARETVIAMTPAPIPPEKPERETNAEEAAAPLLPENPKRGMIADEPAPPLPKPKPSARVVVNVTEEESPAPESSDGSCYSKLKALKVDFLPQAAGRGACRVDRAVMLRSISTGGREVKLPDRPIVNCGFALQFSKWVKATGVPLAKLYTGPGYQCRGRNGSSSGKLSEHARGNAVDIERMELASGKALWVRTAHSDRTLKSMRAQACTQFTTVLGPGSNAAHAEHFHFDMAERRGGYRICE
jgi:hypothetical protein